MEKVKKAASILVSILLWLIILVAALFAFTTLATNQPGEVKSLGGISPLTVQTNSMSPTFEAGDLIIIKKVDPKNLKVGDIITFHTIIENEYALNTHRIDAIDDVEGVRSYTTKGDNNEIADTHIIADGDIVGMYAMKLKGFGKVMEFLSSSIGFLVVIVLPLLLFFIYQIYHLVIVSINLKKAIAVEEAQKAAESENEDVEKKKAEAEAALEEAKRIMAEAEAMKAAAAAEKEEKAEDTE